MFKYDRKRATACCHVQLCFLNFASSMVPGSPGHFPEEVCSGLRCEMYDSTLDSIERDKVCDSG